MKVLSETVAFDGRDNLGTTVNREFRILLKTFLSYRDRFDGFLDEISSEVVDTIRELVNCDVELTQDFNTEVTRDLQRGRACVGLPPNPETPIPT